jgi:site-specific DNA recombinase
MNYIIYTRCSTEDQKKGFSHDYQINGLLSSPLCKNGNHIATYQDTATGTNFDRINLDAAYKFCKSQRGSIQKILVYKWDRFGRNVGEAFQMIKKFKDIGVEVNCPDFDIDYTDSNWPIMLSITLGMAQSESLKISERTKDGMYTSYRLGYYPASAPVGYLRHFIGEKASLIPDPIKAPIVQQIFTSVAAGEIAINLFQKHKDQLGIKKNAFYHMLRNETYTAQITIKAYKSNPPIEVRCKFKPLISKDLFQKVQDRLDPHKTIYNAQSDDKSFFYAKGIVKKNGEMTAYYSKSKSGKKVPYYESKKTKGSILNAQKVHSTIEQVISQLTMDIPLEKKIIAEEIFLKDNEYNQSLLKNLNQELIQKISMIKKIELDYLNSQITAPQFQSLLSHCESEIESINQKILELNIKIQTTTDQFQDFFEHLTNLYKLFSKSTPYNKNKLLKAIFPEGIYISKPDYTLRTPVINEMIELMCSNPVICEEIKMDLSDVNDLSPCEGPNPNQFRTLPTNPIPSIQHHINLLIQAIA